ncbi:sugar acetyltransferase [Brevibacillus choshinensis]|uniref:Sugar acetyltransferase n=1 Tax=Brevibacillus choshinensis TaxID=54911 RepID=A0ABR5N7U4_BRECH|nr:acetyltransferase [Brevibacillus choshinensis]KQL46517.1 sugar acetyltransferase [Brevibacillus choshinensis]
MRVPIIVLGGGGHSKVIMNTLLMTSCNVKGFTTPDTLDQIDSIYGIIRLGTDDVVRSIDPTQYKLVNGIGSVGYPGIRKDIFYSFKNIGFHFENVIHPSVILPKDTVLLEGVQLMAGVIIQPGCNIGANTIINTRATIEHDCRIGDNVHVAPGAVICGDVTIGDNVHIGAGAIVIQGVRIGKNSVIGAGSVVIRNVAEGVKVVGVPAEEV